MRSPLCCCPALAEPRLPDSLRSGWKRSLPASIWALVNVWLTVTSIQLVPSLLYCNLPSPGSWVIFTPRLASAPVDVLDPESRPPKHQRLVFKSADAGWCSRRRVIHTDHGNGGGGDVELLLPSVTVTVMVRGTALGFSLSLVKVMFLMR